MPATASGGSVFPRALLTAFVFACLSLVARAAPAAPSGLRAAVTGATAVTLIWDDNSTDETHFELSYTNNGITNSPRALGSGSTAAKGTLSYNFSPLPVANQTYTFKVRSYTTTSSNASAYSNTISFLPADFTAPSMVGATPQTDGSILLTWVDSAINEAGYSIEYRVLPSGTFSVVDSTGPNITGYYLGGLTPGASYEFRVRGFKGTAAVPTATTAYTATASALVPATLNAPTGLAAAALAPQERSTRLTFSDNTANNVGYEVEKRVTGLTDFDYLGDIGDSSSINIPSLLDPGTSYDLRIRAFYQHGTDPKVYSAYSNTVTYVTPFYAPTAPVATAVSDKQVNLAWTDNSQAEGGYAIYARTSGAATFDFVSYAATNATTYSVTGLSPNTTYEFQVAAAYQTSAPRTIVLESARTASVSAKSRDGFTSPPYITFDAVNAYSYQAVTSTGVARTSLSSTGLPAGMGFNTTTGQITGTPTQFGVFNATLSATFTGGWTATLPLVVRVNRPPSGPLASVAIASQTLAAGASVSVQLADKFADPDSESAVRVITNQGTMDFILFNTATPQTVANFLSYVNAAANNFNGSVFHRSVPGFVIQGGAFKVDSAPNKFTTTPTSASPQNEPGLANLRGTVAMAKLGGNPNSATDQFFVSLADNRSILDQQNGGFTVFGRVAGNGMTVADTIAALPNATYDVRFDDPTASKPVTSMENWPLTSASAAMDVTKVVSITSLAPIPVLSYSVTANTNPAAVSATISNNSLQLQAVGGGQSSVTVTATDLDGNTVTQTVTVNTSESLASWTAQLGLTGNSALATADPDGDGLSNAEEFAFLSLPNSRASRSRPGFNVGTAPGAYGEISFPVRKFATALTYTVEASDSPAPGAWPTVLWTSTSGFSAPNVSAHTDAADRTDVTIRDTVAAPAGGRRFYRVRVTTP